jgi:hypothetical protein
MLGSWKIDVDGREHVVTIERGQNQKDVVRVNGRVAAKPLGPEETERGISVGGAPYIINRLGPDSYDLVQDEWAMAPQRSREAANHVLAHTRETPLAAVKSSAASFIPIIGWAAVVAVIGLMMLYAVGDNYEELAGKRMKQILTEMQTAGGDDMKMQLAITLWAKNRRQLDTQELSWASEHFDKFLREKDLYNRVFTNYEVVESKEVEGANPQAAIVTFKIEGKEYRVRVPKDTPISWEP